VCVFVPSAHVDFRPWSQVRRWCAGVFAGVLGVYVCVLGVSPIRRWPGPNPEQVCDLLDTIFNF
jgi:hypothetical protein